MSEGHGLFLGVAFSDRSHPACMCSRCGGRYGTSCNLIHAVLTGDHVLLRHMNRIVAAVLKERGLDWRTCYASVTLSAPSAKRLIIEVSNEDVLKEVKKRVKTMFSDVRTPCSFVQLPAKTSAFPEIYMAGTSVVDLRKEPSHTSELLTQAIYGDTLEPLKVSGDWVLARVEDGYVGWIRNWNIVAATRDQMERFLRQAEHRIGSNVVQVFQQPDEESLPVCDAVAGTIIQSRACGKRGWRHVRFPDRKRGYVKSTAVERRPKRRMIVRDHLSMTGLRFLGIPYIWGGTTPKGFDCSGLIQRIFKLNGMSVPRDSDLQSRFGREKPVENLDVLKTGDLLFFGKDRGKITHVAMYLSNDLILHAYGYVRVGSLDPRSSIYEGKLRNDWQVVRDPLLL